jgi:hypothetical protein
MNTRQSAWVSLATLTAAALGFAGARAMATGAPQLSPLTYGGVLTDKDGKPYPAAQDVVLKFYDKVDATAPKCTAPPAQAEAGTGRFSVVLPGECAQAVRDTPDLWSEATVGGGKTVLPRVHVGAVPYALEADNAKVAQGAAGALKGQIDGIATEIEGLKKVQGGGGPKVVDGAGVVLGTPLDVGINSLVLITPKAFQVKVLISGGYNGTQVIYSNKGCSGVPMGYLSPGSLVPLGQYVLSNSGNHYVAAQQTGTVQYYQSILTESGVCSNTPGSGGLFSLKAVSTQEIGLPDNITGPLKIVP